MEQVVLPVELRMVEARVSAVVVSKEVVVETYISTSPDASIAMFSLVMNGRVERFRNDAPLDCSVCQIIE